MEEALAGHPGVRRAAFVLRESTGDEPRPVAYIVADEGYLDRAFSGQGDETRLTEQWRKIYDLYQKPKAAESIGSGLSTHVWKSAYTQQPIPEPEMQEWIGCTLERVRQLDPARVLEIGCGLGALLLPLAPNCERYAGTDISGASIGSLRSRIAASPERWRSAALFERPADRLDDFETGSFDTVIINSVTMYFPSAEYLTKVLMGALRVTRPGGAIFVGDVRSLPLLTTFAVSVELSRADAALTLDELRGRVRKRLRLENELFISPTYFLALKALHPELSRVEIRPKRGTFDNEMNRFRYDVVLRLGGATPTEMAPAWLDWSADRPDLDAIGAVLRRERPEILGIAGIGNARLEKDIRAVDLLSGQAAAATAGELRDMIDGARARGVHPERLFALADDLGYRVDFSWTSARADGSYDAVFMRRDEGHRHALPAIQWPNPAAPSGPLSHHVLGPIQKDRQRRLAKDLRDLLAQRFGGLAPADFVMVQAMPTMHSGGLELAELPPAWLSIS
ncbi:MAG TPA: methyltransferase domain-containing protein [Stellaceae bacterium]